MKTILKYAFHLLIFLPFFAGAQNVPTSYDSDGDGIPDSVDKCPFVKGTAMFGGCPYEIQITADDRDGDGTKDVDDACPDIFGLKHNKGCPDFGPNQPGGTVGLADHSTLFSTKSSSQQAEESDFKQTLLALVSGSANMFAGIKLAPMESDKNKYHTSVCLAGASQCYIAQDSKPYFYAAYGSYAGGELAAAKCAELKHDLLLALNESEWEHKNVADGYVEEFKLWKKNGGTPAVFAYVQKTGKIYSVYVTIENEKPVVGEF